MKQHPFDKLPPRGKKPSTVRTIETWIQQAENRVGIGARRLGWMVASGLVVAAIQRKLHGDGYPCFLIKGGVYLELRFGMEARSTKDVDLLYRGEFENVSIVLNQAFSEPFDGVSFELSDPRPIMVSNRLTKPLRTEVKLQLRGRTWRKISVEVGPPEGMIGEKADCFRTPSLAHFGFSTPPTTAGIGVDYQVAQKLHACTEPHTAERPNNRVRDVLDLLLLKKAFYSDHPTSTKLLDACKDLFSARQKEAVRTGVSKSGRSWPVVVTAHPNWKINYSAYADEIGLSVTIEDALHSINDWIQQIDCG